MLSITLDSEIEERLNALRAKTAISREDFVRRAMLAALEDLEDAVIGEERLENPGKEYSMEEAERILGVDGQVGRESPQGSCQA